MFEGIRRQLIRWLGGLEKPPTKTTLKLAGKPDEIHSLWDYIQFRENTQAHHLTTVIGFEEFVDMDEIRRRIQELFHIEYKNERSLYPYLKTLVDIGLFETIDVGGKRKWRKKAGLLRKKAPEIHDDEGSLTVQQAAQNQQK